MEVRKHKQAKPPGLAAPRARASVNPLHTFDFVQLTNKLSLSLNLPNYQFASINPSRIAFLWSMQPSACVWARLHSPIGAVFKSELSALDHRYYSL